MYIYFDFDYYMIFKRARKFSDISWPEIPYKGYELRNITCFVRQSLKIFSL